VNLTPREKEKLMIALAAHVARRRLSRGVKLNYPESLPIITDFVMEGARDGRSVADLMSESCKLLTRDQVMESIPEVIHDMQVEATFPGSWLATHKWLAEEIVCRRFPLQLILNHCSVQSISRI
jgi:urease subunit gamma